MGEGIYLAFAGWRVGQSPPTLPEPRMPRLTLLAVLLILPSVADASPLFGRWCRRPVVYVPAPCPAPIVQAQPPVAKAEEPVKWSTIRGRVVFEGEPIPMQKFIPKASGARTEEWVVNPFNRGVQNVIVWLAPEQTAEQMEALKSKKLKVFPSFKPEDFHPSTGKPDDRKIVIPAMPWAFVPHVTAMRDGATLTIQNLTTDLEKVKMEGAINPAVNPLLAQQQVFKQKMVAERLPILLESSIHSWLTAYVKVFDHPYFAVTNAEGEFLIPNAPAGNLRLFVWQESAGYRKGAAGRFGDPIKVEKKVMDLGEIKIKESK